MPKQIKNLFTGGNCNMSQNEHSQNPFTQMMNNLILGQTPTNIPQFNKQINMQQELINRQQEFKHMKDNWNMFSKDFDQKTKIEQIHMQKQWEQEQHRRLYQQQMYKQKIWADKEHQHNIMQNQWSKAKIEQEASQWAKQKEMQQAFMKSKADQQQQQKILNAASSMYNTMINDEDPKFQNSKFLNFLGRIKKGEVEIKGNEIVEKEINVMDQSWKKAQQSHFKSINDYNDIWNQKLEEYNQMASDTQNFQKMLEQRYQQVLKQMTENQGMLSQSWQKSSDIQQQNLYKDIDQSYKFAQNNPFINEQNPMKLAIQLLNKGKVNQAVLAMQSHLQKQKDPQAWRILGRVFQQQDQDQKACSCLLQSIKIDPHNTDTMLALGVSCTNSFDQIKAMNYLRDWMLAIPKYASLIDPNILPLQLNTPTVKLEDIKQAIKRMVITFENVCNVNKGDPDLLTATAVLHFINRDFDVAVERFKQALNFDQNNYSLWNKLGATLAHLGRADQAINCYHRALQVKPNYVRAWVNLGICHSFKNNYQQAARFYLNSLILRPDAKHLWSYLQGVFMCMQRYDLISKISTFNPLTFKDNFQLIDPNQLPEPILQYSTTNQQYLFQERSKIWLNKFLHK